MDADVLDGVINRIFGCGLELAVVLNRSDVDGEVTERLGHVLDELDLVVADIRRTAFSTVEAERGARIF